MNYIFTEIIDPTQTVPLTTQVYGINNLGQIVGLSHGQGAFVYSGGTFTHLAAPVGAVPQDINDAGQIVGTYYPGDYTAHAFLLQGGTVTALTAPTSFGQLSDSFRLLTPYGVNDFGEIVGAYSATQSNGNYVERGFLYSGGIYTALDNPLSFDPIYGGITSVSDINNLGQIVGYWHNGESQASGSFIYSNGVYAPLSAPGTPVLAQGRLHLNDLGQVAGEYYDNATAKFKGFIYSNGTYTDFVDPNGGVPRGINDAGQIITVIDEGGGLHRSFLATPTTFPAVAVEGSMYGKVGTAAEVDLLANQFLPPQAANAMAHGLNALVYSCEALGLVFAFNDESGSTGFATSFGPSNASMPNSTAGDAAFAAAAASVIFGPAATANTSGAIQGWVSAWEAVYTSNGIPGIANATADQINLAARGAAWGDAVGVVLTNNFGPLYDQTINFAENAAKGTAIYGASLASQPTFDPTAEAREVQLTGVALDHGSNL